MYYRKLILKVEPTGQRAVEPPEVAKTSLRPKNDLVNKRVRAVWLLINVNKKS